LAPSFWREYRSGRVSVDRGLGSAAHRSREDDGLHASAVNVLLILVPLMPNLPPAILVLLLRFSISQMDVPTRQASTMTIVTAG